MLGAREYIPTSVNFAMAMSEGFVMCNLVLAAVFWGTLDVNSSPLYRFRYGCFGLCVCFLVIHAVLVSKAATDIANWAPILNDWSTATECAIGCIVFLFVPRRLYQLSKYTLNQQEEVKSAEAGEDAIKAHEENEDEDESAAASSPEASAVQLESQSSTGTSGSVTAPASTSAKPAVRHKPLVKKMLFWSLLVAINCLASIVQLIVQEDYESTPSPGRNTKSGWLMNTMYRGMCGCTMATCQLLLYQPKKRRSGSGSTIGGSVSGPKSTTS